MALERKSFWKEAVALPLWPHSRGLDGGGQHLWIATRLLEGPQTPPSGRQLRNGHVPPEERLKRT